MADISSYLAAILSAVYGEDVRGSIHDAIDIINKVGEVLMNTGTAVTGPTSSSTGFYEGSYYINTSTFELWKCIGTDAWQSQGILKGDDGNGIVSVTKTGTAGLVDTYTITFDDGDTETFQITNGADGQNGSKWYKGTAISGTGSSITGFPGVKDDFYLNSANGNVYVCTKTGGASVPDPAEWDFVLTLTGGGGGSSVTVIDSLTSTSSTDALSANQGRVLKGLVDAKADNDPAFVQAGTRANIVSGETLSTLFGKIKKWFADLADLAFIAIDGSSSTKYLRGDGTWQAFPNVTPEDGQLTIQKNGSTVQTFTANQATNVAANIVTDEWHGLTKTVSSGMFNFTVDDSKGYGYEVFVDITGSSVNKNPSYQISSISGSGTSSCDIYFTTDADEGATVKLRYIK